MKMAKGVTRRTGSQSYQWGIKVPKDLAALYRGPWAERVSLGTGDLREANRLAANLEAKWQNTFATDRHRLNPTTEALTPKLVQRLAAAWSAELLGEDAKARLNASTVGTDYVFRGATFMHAPGELPKGLEMSMVSADLLPNPDQGVFDGYSNPQLAALQQQNLRTLSGWREDMARGRLDVAKRALDWQAHLEGVKIYWDSAEARSHLADFQCSMIACAETLVARSKGQVSDSERIGQTITAHSPTPTPTSRPEGAAHTIFDALDAWKVREVERPEKTVKQFAYAADLFAKLMPGRSLESLTTACGDDLTTNLKHWAHNEGNSIRTAHNRHREIAALLEVAYRKGWCKVRPLEHTTIPKPASDRAAWKPEDVKRLLTAPLFTAYAIPSESKAGLDAAYWLPLLGLFTGARISELCQLRTTDITEEADGLVFEIRENEEHGQRLKNASSRRRIPVHSTLITLGFKDYWQAIAKAGPCSLFPALPLTGVNGAGGQFGKWFGDFKKAQGFDVTLSFHSFRQTLQTRLEAAKVTPPIIDAIAGHAGEGTGGRSYSRLRNQPEELRPHLELLTFPGLSLPRVFERPVWTPEWKSKRLKVSKTAKT